MLSYLSLPLSRYTALPACNLLGQYAIGIDINLIEACRLPYADHLSFQLKRLDRDACSMGKISNYTQVVVFALGPGSTLQHAEGLVKAFEVICRSCSEGQQSDEEISSSHHQHKQLLDRGIKCMQQEPQIAIRPREAAFSPTERYAASTG